MPGWVTLDELINDMKFDDQEITSAADLDPAEAQRLQRDLDAAVDFVERIHSGRYNFDGAPSTLPAPPATIKLGTLMMAKLLDTRRRSPGGFVSAGDQGVARVAYSDPDINRLLRLGKHAIPKTG